MVKRSLYYLSRMYTNQLSEGENYRELPRTVAINILRFNYLKEKNFHNAYRFKNIKNDNELTDIMEIHFIELPKFNENKEGKELVKSLKEYDKNNIDMLKAWTLFLKKPTNEYILEIEDNINELKEAKKELTIISADEKNRELYEMRRASLHDRVSALESAEEFGYKKAQEKYQKEILKEQKEKERALKREKKAQKEKEKAQREKEKAQREKEKAQREKEKAERRIISVILNLSKIGLTKEEISDSLKLSVKDIEQIINNIK